MYGLPCSPVVLPHLSACKCGIISSASSRLAASPVHPSCPSAPLLPVWMNVSSLTPWLSDFHTVQFSESSGYFLFSSLLLSLFWLCEEAKLIYLHLHLGHCFSFLATPAPSQVEAVCHTQNREGTWRKASGTWSPEDPAVLCITRSACLAGEVTCFGVR